MPAIFEVVAVVVPPAVLVDMALFSSASIAESSLPRIRFNSSDAPACISWLYDVRTSASVSREN